MIGLFGGTFDPVHIGHEQMVRVALRYGLSRVVVMPCFLSPHKTGEDNQQPASAADRLHMLQLAFAGMEGVEISTYEVDKGGVSFTWQTLAFLQRQNPQEKVALIVGLDQYYAFPKWEKFAEWSRGLDIFVFKRAGLNPPAADSIPSGPQFHWPTEEILQVAASEIRQRIKNGLSLSSCLSPEVSAYIKIRGLYAGN